MLVTNLTALRKDLYKTVKAVAQFNETVTVTSKSGNVVIVSESDYNSLIETVYLMSQPGVFKELIEAKKAKPSDYVNYDSDKEW